jgi:hypothetical protein
MGIRKKGFCSLLRGLRGLQGLRGGRVARNEIETSKKGGQGVGFCSTVLPLVLHRHRYDQEDRRSEQNGSCE